jgi:small nuclear ribonucleoprotein (snRNP)-like protein
MIKSIFLILLSFLVFFPLFSEEAPPDFQKKIVRIKVTSQSPNFMYPWQSKKPSTIEGNGIVVNKNKILVLASMIEYYTSIEIKKNYSNQIYSAKLSKIDWESNLALLDVFEEDFFSDLESVSFQTKIIPNKSLSILHNDIHGNLNLLNAKYINIENETYPFGHFDLPYYNIHTGDKIQGNCELLVLKENAIGVIYKFVSNKNIARGIPGFIIDQFLNNKSKSNHSVFPYKGFKYKPILDNATKEYYGLPKEKDGILVTAVLPNSSASKSLKVNDIITEFGGYKIDYQGYFQHKTYGKQPISFIAHTGKEMGYTKGKKLPIKIIRDRNEMNVNITLKSFPYKSIKIPHMHNFNKNPNYTIQAGFIFTEFTEFLLREWGVNWRTRVDKKLLYMVDYNKYHKLKERGFVLILVQVLPDEVNNGYHHLTMELIRLVDEKPVHSIKELEYVIQNTENSTVKIDLENGTTIILDKTNLNETNEKIAKKFNIPKLSNY